MKILLVESNKPVALGLAGALRADGAEVVFASDAIQTLGVAQKEKPDLILLSTQLPGGGGLQVLQRLRSLVHTAITPVIAMCETAAERQQMLAAAAEDALLRPIDPGALLQAIRKHTGQRPVVASPPAEVIRAENRLRALQETELLDSPPSELFDQLTWLAARLVSAPTATVSLIAQDRQFFKSQIGMPQPLAAARETPLSHSFCQWVVSGNEPLVVSDAREHAVLRHNPAVQDYNVVAYAGVPLSAPNREVIGSFCAIDSVPHRWSDDDLSTLRDLAIIAESYTASHIERISGPPPASALQAIARGTAAAARILQNYDSHLDQRGRRVLLQAIEKQNEQLAKFAAVGPS